MLIALSGRPLCTTYDVIDLNVNRYSWWADGKAKIDLSTQQSILDMDGILTV